MINVDLNYLYDIAILETASNRINTAEYYYLC